MARVVRFHEIGGHEVLKIEDVEVPPPGKAEVQIRVHALGLNRAESMFRSGQYISDPKFPAKNGYEAAGTVAAIDDGVTGFKIGDAVSVVPGFDKGARLVFDPVGGPTIAKLVKAMANFGIFFIYGALSTEPSPLPLFDLVIKDLTIRGYKLMEVTTNPVRLERGKKFINEGLADGSLRPIIAKTFPLEQIVEAHRYLESNQQIGKIVVTV
jgi:NADPH:quinone reductase-like Zn-dependent oxidoreductase